MPPPEQPTGVPHRRRRFLAAAAAVVLVAAGVTAWATGGLDSSRGPAAVRPGRDVDQHLFRTRLLRARTAWLQESKYTERRHVLLVTASVTNLSRETALLRGPATDHNFPHSLFLRWPGTGPRPIFSRARAYKGETSTWMLHPRLPGFVVLEYVLPAGAVTPPQVTIDLAEFEYTEAGILDPRGYWEFKAAGFRTVKVRDPKNGRLRTTTKIDPELAARVTLPVEVAS
ncbi:hypothetical protein ACRYCC_04080 [Actinomadura scrupuli]|uniref:hypothetical protein n=1 Tax=Actinomadura scrupuli TaxID=559629 RepID=UPI003D974558